MLVELLCGLGIAALYIWEIKNSALYPADMPHPPNAELAVSWPFILHEQFVAHVMSHLVDARRFADRRGRKDNTRRHKPAGHAFGTDFGRDLAVVRCCPTLRCNSMDGMWIS